MEEGGSVENSTNNDYLTTEEPRGLILTPPNEYISKSAIILRSTVLQIFYRIFSLFLADCENIGM